jgi:adenosylcobinamide-GDP ribazoletransferase
VTSWVAELRLAASFLTRLPLGTQAEVSERLLGRSLAWFPLVGLALGALLAGTAHLLQGSFPPAVLAALLIVLLVAVTGALHLDGVADVADGCYGLRDRESRLRIMKDSRVGAMGVVAVASVMLLKFAALFAMPPERLLPALLIAPAGGRWLSCALAVTSSYARPEGGTGGAFVAHAGSRELLLASVILAAAALALFGAGGGLLLLAAFALQLWGWRSYSRHKLGGVTGDVLGAACEWCEALLWLILTSVAFPLA